MNRQESAFHRGLPAVAAADGWYHLMPLGEQPGFAVRPDGSRKPIVEVVDETSLHRIMAAYEAAKADPHWPGYLVGREHYSQEPDGSTEALAWATELQVRNTADVPERERGIWARLSKTPLGEAQIGSVYKYLSTVNRLELIAANRYRLIDIDDIGATNKPAFTTLVPAMHKAGAQTEEDPNMEKLKALCAKHNIMVPDGADEDAMLELLSAALAKGITAEAEKETAMNRATAAETELAGIRQAKLEADADAFVAQHKAVIKDLAAVRTQFIANRTATEALFAGLKPAGDAAPVVLHRRDAQRPAGAVTPEPNRDAERQEVLDQVKARHKGINNSQAWALAASLKPELFREEASKG